MATRNLYEAAEIWRQRTHHLRDVMEEAEAPAYKAKAQRIWFAMVDRMLRVTAQVSEHQRKTRFVSNFPSGGMASKREGAEPVIPEWLKNRPSPFA